MPYAKIIIGDSRKMLELKDNSIDLVLTSPPYWHIKDYGVEGQIGYGQRLHEYLKDLYRVWMEVYRVLKPGRKFVVNIGDQFARAKVYGRYKVIPLHAEVIVQCEHIGFDYMGAIIWQKKTTMNTSGGAVVMGSYPYPPNGIVEIDYEHILIFKKPGKSPRVPKEIKEKSKLSKEEWKKFFSGHWHFSGAKQIEHEAMFPDELPYRIIKMFSFVGDTVLDPFLGSGTTVKVALSLGRNAIGYEINPKLEDVIREKVGNDILKTSKIEFLHQTKPKPVSLTSGVSLTEAASKLKLSLPEVDYEPTIKDASPLIEPEKIESELEKRLHRVVDIVDAKTLQLDNGRKVQLLGVEPTSDEDARDYLRRYVLRKQVYLKFDGEKTDMRSPILAYVYLKNGIFVNAYMIKSGLAKPDESVRHRLSNKFRELCKKET